MPPARSLDFVCLWELAERCFEINQRSFASFTINVENEYAAAFASSYANVCFWEFVKPRRDRVDVRRGGSGPFFDEWNLSAEWYDAPATRSVRKRSFNDC